MTNKRHSFRSSKHVNGEVVQHPAERIRECQLACRAIEGVIQERLVLSMLNRWWQSGNPPREVLLYRNLVAASIPSPKLAPHMRNPRGRAEAYFRR